MLFTRAVKPTLTPIGLHHEDTLRFLLTGMPNFFEVATGDIKMCGVIVTADAATGRATSIRRISIPFKPAENVSYDASDGKAEGGMDEL